MVAGEYDHGIVGETKLVEPLEYLGNAVVDHGDHAVGERDRLARFTFGHCEGGLGVSDARAGVARRMQRCDMRRLRPVADPERVRQRHVRGLVHVPIAAGRRERMVRIGKRTLDEERSVIAALRVRVEVGERALDHVGRWIKVFRQARAPRLRQHVVVRQRIVRSTQCIAVRAPIVQPAGIIAVHAGGVARAQLHMVEAVVGQAHRVGGIARPFAGVLLVVGGVAAVFFLGFVVAAGRGAVARRASQPASVTAACR